MPIFHTFQTVCKEKKWLPDFNPLSPGFNPFFAEVCNPITRQVIELESNQNHPRIQQVL